MKGCWVQVWHPESPGLRITVWRPWWRRKMRPFATLAEMASFHRPVIDATVAAAAPSTPAPTEEVNDG